jgi:RHS repeat-associated protein
LFSNAHYSPFGSLTIDTLGNGVTESRSYNKRLWQQSSTATFGSTTPYSFSVASFAPNGDILAANDSVNGTWSYSYDEVNRLCNANQSSTLPVCHQSALYTYEYDRFGNRWHQNGPQSSQLSFDANNHITAVTGIGYDLGGNLTSDGSGPGAHGYFYDAENRIIQVDGTLGTCSTATACYVYNAAGQRVRKTTGISSMDHLYDLDGHKVAEVDPTGVFMRGELYAGDRHFAIFAPDPGPTGATFFTHGDWLGTERARTDMTGTKCESITSLPFGDGQTISDSCGDSAGDVSPMHFTGKERDSESGLDNFRARYFGSSLGRFTRPDPVMFSKQKVADPQQWNMYSYARNNPLRLLDPTGMYVCKGTKDQCAKIEDALAKAREAAKSKDLSAKERAAIKKVTDFYGAANDPKDGVTVQFGKVTKGGVAATDSYREDGVFKTDVTFDTKQFKSLSTVEVAGAAVHEGVHGLDGIAAGGRNPETRTEELATERHAYNVETYVPEGLGVSYPGLWNPAWPPEYAQGNRYTGVLRGTLASTAAFCSDSVGIPGC